MPGRVAPLALFAVGFVQLPLAFTGPALTHLPGDLIDGRFNNYVLEHGFRWLTGPRVGFWDAPFCHPATGMTAASDAHVGTLPLYAMLRFAGAGPERAFQLWWLLLFAANYVAAYLSLRWFGFRRAGSAGGAYLFAFGLPVIAVVAHAQLSARFLVPVAFAAAWAFMRQPGWRPLAVLAGSVVGQMAMTLYIGLLLAGVLIGFAVAVAIITRIPWRDVLLPNRREFAVRCVVLTAAAFAGSLLVRPYLAQSGRLVALESDVRAIAPDAVAWLRPPAGSTTWEWVRPRLPVPHYEYEKILFPGGVALAAAVVAVARRDRLSLAAALCVLPVPLAFAEFDGRSLHQLALDVPGVAKLRAPGRVVLVLLAPLGVSVAAMIDSARRRHPLAAAVLLGLLAADHAISPAKPGESYNDGEPYYRIPLDDARSRREAWAAAIRAAGPGRSLVYAFPDPAVSDLDWAVEQLDVMCGAFDAGVPTANGYSGYWPAGWFRFDSASGLFHWVKQRVPLTPDVCRRAVLFGEPGGACDTAFEKSVRAETPPRPKPRAGGWR